MKVAVTSQGRDPASAVDPRFGRARYFIVFDTQSGQFEPVDNEQNLNAVQGAGIQAAACVARHGVDAVLTGHCGPKAFQALSAGGIRVYLGAAGTDFTATGGLTLADDLALENGETVSNTTDEVVSVSDGTDTFDIDLTASVSLTATPATGDFTVEAADQVAINVGLSAVMVKPSARPLPKSPFPPPR